MPDQGIEISFVIPCHNEAENLRPLMAMVHEAMTDLGKSFEVIITDDGSTDGSWEVLKTTARTDRRLRIQRFRSRCGQSAASWAGIEAARGIYIVTIDADLQNDLKDLPKFMEALKVYDCVCGTRVATRHEGDSSLRIIASRFANWFRNKVLSDDFSDSACSFRAFKRECVSRIQFFHGAHRFLPALFKMAGFSVTEVGIQNRTRVAGKSHYGIGNRSLTAFIDLIGVWWVKKRMLRYEITEKMP